MWRTLACATLAAAGVLALPRPAHADPTTDAKVAEDLANQAFEAYSKGEFQSAISLYKRAYQTSSAGIILFNIANIYDKKLRDKEQALEYYRRYLRSGDTEPDLVRRASERIDIVRADIEAAKQAMPEPTRPSTSTQTPTDAAGSVATTPEEPPKPKPPRPLLQTAGMIAVGVGVIGGFGISAWQGFVAKSKNDDAEDACQGATCDDRRGLELTDEARSAARISTVSAIAGVALVAGGIALYLYAPKNKEEQVTQTAIRITPELAPERAGIAISGAW